jgi:choline dehydrogenase-like flavoprotein
VEAGAGAEGVIVDPRTFSGDATVATDVVVVGSGAGGAVVARKLAAAGIRVVLLEEGPLLSADDFTQREEQMYPRLYREHGTRATADYSVLVSQGRALGGSTVPSFCLCFRVPESVLEAWRRRVRITLSADDLAPHLAWLEEVLSIAEAPADAPGKVNRLVESGAALLGWRGLRPRHNRVDCVGCGYCALGCTYGRKRDASLTLIPEASALGAIVVPNAEVETIERRGDTVHGVTATLTGTSPDLNYRLRIESKVVVLAAGAINSPRLWIKSRLPGVGGAVGRYLHLQPQVFVGGVFDEEVEPWRGMPQAFVVDEFLRLDQEPEGGFLLMPAVGHPVAMASLLPSLGRVHRDLMLAARNLALVSITLNDRTSGRVDVDRRGQPSVTYHLIDEDQDTLVEAMRRAADLLFAAGARRVVLPFNQPTVLTRRGEYKVLESRRIRSSDPLLLSFAPHGSLRMGLDRASSVVGPLGEAHAIKRLFVADASVFPGQAGVPPQLTVMALAARTAEHIAGRAAELGLQ